MANTEQPEGAAGEAAAVMTESQPLLPLLRKAAPLGPRSITPNEAGAVLVLALHCKLVEAGLQPDPLSDPRNKFVPPLGWHGTYKDEWVINYNAPGKANRMALHCSLQRVTGRMFISAMEVGRPPNTKVLGLQLPNYVPDTLAVSAPDWDGVVVRQDAMVAMLSEYVIEPWLRDAENLPFGLQGSGSLPDALAARASALAGWLPPPGSDARRYLLVAAGVGLAAVAAYALVASVQRRRRV